MNTNRNSKTRRWVKPATVAAGTALVASMTAAPAYAWHLHSTVSGNIKHADMMPASKAAPTQGDGENILLIGGATKTRGATDTGMFVLAHISEDRQRLDLVQFPRDTEVKGNKELQQIPANGNEKQVVKAIEKLTDVQIDHVAKLGWDNVRDLVNTVDGVTIDGKTMTGEQVLDWMGSEDVDADTTGQDIAQGERQMEFLKAVMAKAADEGYLTSPTKLSNLLDVSTREMTVDKGWSVTDMEKLALSMKDIGANDVYSWTAPTAENTKMETLSEHLRDDSMAEYAN